jgi:hypothetical protein
MSTFVFAYRTPEGYAGSADTAAAWTAWFADLDAKLIDRGNPVVGRQSLGNCGTDTLLGGYTLISAEDLASAVAVARGCPILAAGGGVEVGELAPVNAERRAAA